MILEEKNSPEIFKFYFDLLSRFAYTCDEEDVCLRVSEFMGSVAFYGINTQVYEQMHEFFKEAGIGASLPEAVSKHIAPKLKGNNNEYDYLMYMLYNFSTEFDLSEIDGFTFERIRENMAAYAFSY